MWVTEDCPDLCSETQLINEVLSSLTQLSRCFLWLNSFDEMTERFTPTCRFISSDLTYHTLCQFDHRFIEKFVIPITMIVIPITMKLGRENIGKPFAEDWRDVYNAKHQSNWVWSDSLINSCVQISYLKNHFIFIWLFYTTTLVSHILLWGLQ